MRLADLFEMSHLNKLRFSHALDRLQDLNLVRRYNAGYGEPGLELTEKDRAYAVENNLDQDPKTL